jgi:hypothetical protein
MITAAGGPAIARRPNGWGGFVRVHAFTPVEVPERTRTLANERKRT